MRLIDGEGLGRMLQEVNPVTPAVAVYAEGTAGGGVGGGAEAAPLCPRCGVAMRRRVARRVAKAGESFWGCVNFPKCREIRG